MNRNHFDIIIIGAGLSGIGAACHFSKNCPDKSYTVFEARDKIGGTWDLFKYPGIRSDSDMHTFSYRFKPWTHHKSISDASTILQYLEETVEEYQLNDKINFNHQMTAVSWSSQQKEWTVHGTDKITAQAVQARCNFLMLCTGYYDYEKGYTPAFKGLDNYQGQFVHPQKWTPDIQYENKEVIVIGSGATAVTLIPAMVEKAMHISMLQRSPSYMISRPLHDPFARIVHRMLPGKLAHFLSRWKNILLSMYLYRVARKYPEKTAEYIQDQVRKELPSNYDLDTHFSPNYKPWDERLCVIPDNDLFQAIKSGKCTMLTDHIDRFTADGILLQSGEEIKADLIISATGLVLKMAGGMKITVDGEEQHFSQLLNYKGLMIENIPNMAAIIGYTNASWTLKADLVCDYVCRLLKYMNENDYIYCTPKTAEKDMVKRPVIDFSSGYIQRGIDVLPKQGDQFPWRLHQNYVKDMIMLKYRKLDDNYLEFVK